MAQKKITDLTLRSNFDATVNLASDDATRTWRTTGAQVRAFCLPGADEIERDWLKVGAIARENAVSASTTHPVGDTEDVILLSGASFTATLPTAASISGRIKTFVHQGTSGTHVYTIATTGGQTIGGLASEYLAVNGHVLRVMSDGTNWIILNRSIKRDYTQLRGYNGYGSTNTKIPRFDSVFASSENNALYTKVTDSATLGNSFTFARACWVRLRLHALAPNDSGTHDWGLSLNSAQLTTDIQSITDANRLWLAENSVSGSTRHSATAVWEGPVATSDVIRVHSNGIAPHSDGTLHFSITAEVLN